MKCSIKKRSLFFCSFLMLITFTTFYCVSNFSKSDIKLTEVALAEEITDSSELSSLSVVGFENNLNPAFSSGTTDYDLSISANIIDLEIQYETVSKGENVTVEIQGNRYLKNSSGDITIKVTNTLAAQPTTYTIHYTKDLNPITQSVFTFTQKDEAQEFETTMTGMYRIELWGAQGGHPSNNNVNFGGYTAGDIMLRADTKLYFYVGKQGSASNEQSFNGGGAGGLSEGANKGYSGGGATDVRLVDGDWFDTTSLASRIMVAAGSGGTSGHLNYDNAGGHSVAGGLKGYAGGYYSGHDYDNQNGKGASQILGGAAGNNIFGATGNNERGTFGIGGSALSSSSQRGAGGGGGGYFGGGAGGSTLNEGYGHGGGGGSSYISGHAGCVAITAEDNLDPRLDENESYCLDDTENVVCSLHYSGYKFVKTVMVDGNGYDWTTSIGEQTNMPKQSTTGTMKGNQGNGFAKVTLLSLPSDDNYLTNLESNTGTWDKAFDPTIETYNVTISAYTAKITLSGEVSDEYASVTGLTEYSIALGETKGINVMVRSASGISRTYRVNVTRSEHELTQSSTKLRSLTLGNGSYPIDFQPLVDVYSIAIEKNAMEVKVNAVTFDENAKVKIIQNEYLINPTGTILIEVTKEGIEKTTYKVNYEKTLPPIVESNLATTFNYTGEPKEYVVPYTTTYLIQLWGAMGNGTAYGAYTEGQIRLTKGMSLFFYVGNSGTGQQNVTRFNNGTGNSGGYNGGGATDVRLKGGTWSSFESLKERIMVAGAGGSGDNPGAGGGLVGYSGGGTSGGTQTATGGRQSTSYTLPKFGIADGGCTGGNGYYPGGAATCANGAGGGSSYISGHDGCIAISGDSTTFDNITPASDSIHYSGYAFTNTKMVDGKGFEWTTEIDEKNGMPSWNGDTNIYGNASTGYAKITMFDVSYDDYLTDISSNIGSWDKEFDPTIYDYTLTIDKYESKVTLVGTLSDEDATVTGFGEYSLLPGRTKTVPIVVTAPSGRTRTYNVNIKRNALQVGERNTKLYDLYIDGVKLDKPFSSLTDEYAIEISKNIYDLNIHALAYDDNVKIEINGNKFITDERGTITVKVIALDADQEEVPPTTYYIRYDKYDSNDILYTYDDPGYETFNPPYDGNYVIELWGAQGGTGYHSTQPTPGKGAYTKGTITLSKNDELYIYIGGKGENAANATYVAQGGYNGGGNGVISVDRDESSGAGGGATDVRLVESDDPKDIVSLRSRIMVAAGGGGSHSTNVTSYTDGMAGGALQVTGQLSTWMNYWSPVVNQTTGGAFGYGLNGISDYHAGAGGGGGYYGGYTTSIKNSNGYTYSGRASGGSSFISGHLGSVAVTSQSDTTPRKDSLGVDCTNGTTDIVCSYHYSGFIFRDTEMISGLNLMPNYSGTDRMTGSSGNGYAKITHADLKSQNAYLDDLKIFEYNYEDEPYAHIEFDSLEEEYNVTIGKYTRTFRVEATASDELATIANLGDYDIEPQETKRVEIIVTSEAGNTKTYIVNVTREELDEEHTNLLRNITIDKFELNEKFYSEKEDYTVDVYSTEIDLVVNTFKYDSETVVNVTGHKYIANDTGVITVTAKHVGIEEDKVYRITYKKVNPSMEEKTFTYKGEYQTWTAPLPAKYKIEVYGASGGGSTVNAHTTASSGGLGGYAEATFGIKKGQKLYIYAGGKGTYGAGASAYGGPVGGWNGGGNGGSNISGSGGGATDVRVTPTSKPNIWNEAESLYSRIIVAGGAGGADNAGGTLNGSDDGSGGSGDGLTGQGAWYNGTYTPSYGGTQTEGNALGQGAHVTTNTDTGGAGGGYYGGLATNYGNGGAGAGSSYIKNYPKADTTYLEYQGDIKFFNGSFRAAMNNGDGFARISFIALSSDNPYLSELSVTTDLGPVEFDETFDPKNTEYTAYLDKYTEIFTINGTLSSLDSKVEGLGKYTINPGETKEIPIVATSEAGTTKTYTITITREGFDEDEHTTKLRYINIDDYKLREDFYSTKYEYSMNVYSNEIDAFIHPVPYDDKAIVEFVNNSDKYIKRSPGEIIIRVSLPDEYVDPGNEDTEPTTYTILYTKVYTTEPSKNDYLSSLETSVGSLDKEFDRLEYNYEIHLAGDEVGTRLTGEADDKMALVTGLDKYYKVDAGSSINVPITVTSDYGTTRTYVVKITRDNYDGDVDTPLLKSLVIEEYENDIDFSSNVFEYDIVLPKGEIDLTINAIPYDDTANVTVTGDKYLVNEDEDGVGTITVTVTKGSKHTDYIIRYTRYENYIENYGCINELANNAYSTNNYTTFKVPYTGRYTFELWGAQGGTSMGEGSYTHSGSKVGGMGGYTKGTIELEKDTLLYIYVGCKGQDALNRGNAAGGWNGGGNGANDESDNESAGGGGGATDIRLVPGKWNYGKSLASRIMVAAGGGGGAYNRPGEYGGGLVGGSTPYVSGATQTTGYKFGIGENGVHVDVNVEVAGGGGGYYGGNAKSSGAKDVYLATGAGGSSYISGYTGSVAIKSMSDTTPRLDSEGELCINGTTDNLCSIHYSGLKFTNTQMFAGNETQPSPTSSTTQVGNSGNGYAKISMELSQDNYLSSLESDYGEWDLEFTPTTKNYEIHLSQYEAYVNLTGTVSDPNANVTGLNKMYEIGLGEIINVPIIVTAPNGDQKTYTITLRRDDYTDEHSTKLSHLEVIKYETNYLKPKFTPINENYSITVDSSEAELYVYYDKFDSAARVQVTGDGRLQDGAETGVITVLVTLPDEYVDPNKESTQPTTYTITYNTQSIPAGTEYEFGYTGDYQTFVVPTTGIYKLETWGAQGGGRDEIVTTTQLGIGGNGGYSTGEIKLYKDQKLYVYVGGRGKSSTSGIALGGFNGGGASWATDGNEPAGGGGGATDIRTEVGNLYTRFIVAGGGGGGGEDGEAGGAGGGLNGINTNNSCAGTQTSGACGSAFGQGASTPYDGGAGGGGWYGGGTAGGSLTIPTANSGNDANGASGGSGFVYTGATSSNTPAGYRLDEKWYLDNAKTIAGNAPVPTIHDNNNQTMYGKEGNGYAIITLLKTTSRNNYLESLTSNYGTLAPVPFTPDNQNYTLTLDAYTPKFTISGTTIDEEATVVGFETYKIEPGETKNVDIIVTSTSGDQRTYRIEATRAEFTDEHSSLLKDLILDDGLGIDLLPDFNSKVKEYNISLYPNIADIEIEGIPYDEDPDVEIEYKGHRNLQDSGLIVVVVRHNAATPNETVYKIRYTKDRSLDDYVPTSEDIVTKFDYTGSMQTYTATANANYIVELWGAQGNHANNGRSYGGKGAYTKGTIELEKDTKLFVFVGQNRTDRSASWNAGTTGGGSSDTTNGGGPNGYGGGGATDIRLVRPLAETTWNDINTLYSRIMVAAGGGGASNYAYPIDGGAGGALTGFDGKNGKYPANGYPNIPPTGGTQTSGGVTSKANGAPSMAYGAAGGFGTGGNGESSYGAGAGAGYYNGGGGGHSSHSVDSGAGGSSFISGHLGSVAIANAGSLTPRKDSTDNLCANGTTDITCSYHYSDYIFTDTLMLSGEDKMPSKTGTGYTVGNSGNGYAKITQILLDKDNYLKSLTSDYGTWNKTFDPLIEEYTITLDENAMALNLTGELSNSDATVTGLGYYEIELGEERDIPIIVTAENGDQKTYTIKVVKRNYSGYHTTKLKKLHLYAENIGILTPAFNSLVNDYTIELFFNNINVEVLYETFDELANVEVIGDRYLIEHTGEIIINVTLPDEYVDANNEETQPRTYTITYNKEEQPEELKESYVYEYKGQYETFTAPYSGEYYIEAWGASGGGESVNKHTAASSGGLGGYAKALFRMEKGTTLYVYAGGKGTYGVSGSSCGGPVGGWNGGGNAGNSSSGSGGGATDVRMIPTSTPKAWNEAESLYSRIVVAGGAGGADNSGGTYNGGDDGSGGSGGGLSGQGAWIDGGYNAGYAGTQTSGYALGQGGHVTNCTDTGGGGGGYYGGTVTNHNNGGAGGGSGYIKNFEGTDTRYLSYQNGVEFISGSMEIGVRNGDGRAVITPNNLSKDNYLTSLTSTAGTFDKEFSPIVNEYNLTLGLYEEWYTLEGILSDNTANVVGLGEYRLDVGETDRIVITVTAQNGDQQDYIVNVERLTLPEGKHTTKLMDLDVVSYEDTFKPRFDSLVYDYEIEILDGEINLDLSFVKYDELANVSIAIDNNESQIIGNTRINFISEDEGIITVTVTLPDEYVDEFDEYTQETQYKIKYIKSKNVTGVSDLFTCKTNPEPVLWKAPYTGTYTFEAWGASGGNGKYASYANVEYGGLGAYTYGNITLEKDQEIYVYVGCRGKDPTAASNHTTIAGGWNGGGGGVSGGTDDQAASGGGATDFRLVGGAWDDAESLASRIMVAGGGGGGHSYANSNVNARTTWPGINGQALKFEGKIGQWNGGNRSVKVSQTTGGLFGKGTTYTSLEGVHGAGGGGGGYYGGSANFSGNGGPGAGGTSFISGYTGSVAIESSTSISPKVVIEDDQAIMCADGTTNKECSIHYSGLKFYSGVMKTGNEVMPNPLSNGTNMVGNDGNGYASISKTKASRDNYLLNLMVSVSNEFATDTFDPSTVAYAPTFDKFKNEYTLELPDHVTELNIGARPSSDLSTIEGLGTHKVKAGENIYDIVVISESGEENIYKLTVTRDASDNSKARYIDVTGFVESICKGHDGYCEVSPDYDRDTDSYYLTVPAGIRELEWTVTKDHYYQTVNGAGVTRLHGGLNIITIEVISESTNETDLYTYYVTRDMTGNNYIDELIIHSPELTKEEFDFNYLVTEYSFRVANDVTSLDMEVILDDIGNATYEVIIHDEDGDGLFDVGANIVEIVVTAQNGEQRSYVLNVYRLENSNKLLSELHVKDKNNTEYILTPPFEDITTSYTLDVENEIEYVNITATAAYSKTKVTGTGKKDLVTGLNQIHIITTAENGAQETYVIVINRAKSTNAYLSLLKPLEGNFTNPDTGAVDTYVKTKNNYSMTVNPYVKELNLNIVKDEPNQTYKVTGNGNFRIGPNTVKVVVTAEAGNTNTYTIIVTKQGSTINTLATLTTNRGEVTPVGESTPSFSPDKNNYKITVENDITNITISGTMTDTLSRVTGFGTYKLSTGDNVIPITVTSETGVENIYYVNVFRKYNANANLSSLTVSPGTLNPAFEVTDAIDYDTVNYSVNVDSEVDKITVNGIAQVPKTSKVTGNGTYDLDYGENIIEIKVRAESGNEKIYKITVTRDKSSNTNLKTLIVKEARLDKPFNKMITDYVVKVLNDISEIHIIAEPEDEEAIVTIGSGLVPDFGDNEPIPIIVRAPNGDTKTYTITVFKSEKGGLFLESLEATNCDITFNKNTYYYDCTVDNLVTSTTITAELDQDSKDENATLSGTGTFNNLKVGYNQFPVVVTSEDEEYERVYSIIIEREKSKESRLESLYVTDHTLTPDFDKDQENYSLTTNEYELDIHYKTMNEGATVEIIGNEDLKLGENTVIVKVTSEDKEHTTEYKLKVTRTIRKNNFLSDLWIENETITPEFNKMVTNYKVTVPYETNAVIVGATAEDRNATVEGTGMKTLIPGPNTLTVRVRAENGDTKEYRITVIRLSSPNNYLSSLSVDGETILPQPFDKTNQNYTLQVPYETDSINVIAVPEDDDASVIGDGIVQLKQGVNNVDVYVTAANGNVRKYTIKVTRKDPITAKLLNIEVENYELDPKFTPDNQTYEVTVDYETTKLNFIITKMDPYSTYEIVGNKNFKIGVNTVQINVTASNRIDTFQYTVIVNRQAYSNTFLSYLSVNQGTLSPEFKKTTLTYRVEVANNIEYITLDGAPDYPLSTVEGLKDYKLSVGENNLKVVVKSPAGVKRTYNVIVTRKKSSNAGVTSITSNIGTLTKDDDYEYTLVVPKYTTNIGSANFKVTTADPLATVSMPVTIDLSQTQVYTIKVTSPDGTRTKEYSINVKFDLSHDATIVMLEPSVGELNPEFSPNRNNYRIDLYDDEVEEYFNLYLSEVEATLLNRSLTYQLKDIETTAEINIQAEDGSINTYTVLIVKSKTKEKYLANIAITGVHEVDPTIVLPSFRAKTFEYSLDVPYEVKTIGFDITKRHYNQQIKIYNNDVLQTGDSYNLVVGENVFRIEVTNALNEVTTYTYTINRAKSTNANLKSLKFTSPEITFPDFEKDTLEYSTYIPFDCTQVTVEAIPEDELNASVQISGATYIMDPGEERDITITVTAADGKTKKKYTVTVLKLPEINNLLRTLTVAHGNVFTLTPKFRPGEDTYSLKVSSAVPSVQIDAIAFENDGYVYEHDQAMTIDKLLNQDPSSEDAITYELRKEYQLQMGQTKTIKIDAAIIKDNQLYTKTYTINVERLNNDNTYLEKLTVKNGVLLEEEGFNKTNTGPYHILVDNDVTALDLIAIPEDSAADVKIIDNEVSYGGTNEVKIKVTSANGNRSMTYTLKVEVKGEGNNYLQDLSINGVTVEGFNKYIEEYFVTLENADDSIVVAGIPEKPSAEIVSGDGVVNLDVGDNEINVVVRAQDGQEKTYTINVTREEDAYLTGIATDRGGLIRDFDKQKYEYEITVENDIEDVTIIGWASDTVNAIVSGNDKYENLKVGDNPINLIVVNGNARKVYTVNVKRKGSSNTNLLYLTSTDALIQPEYTHDNDNYEIHIPNYKTKLALSYAVEHNATVQVIGNELNGEDKEVQLLITAEDGTKRTIHIQVYLEDGGYFNSKLSDLSIKETAISPKFNPDDDVFKFTATVSQAYDKVTIVAKPTESTSIVTGDGEVSLALGRNEKQVIVTAQDGSSTTYTLIIFRKDVDNADLTGLYTDIGELSPSFQPKIYKYSIDVPEETVKVHLTAVAYEEKTIEGDGDVYLQKGATVRNIIVTSESGITNTYEVTINRALSTNHDITNITEHTNSMGTFNADKLNYKFDVGDVSNLNNTVVPTDHIKFNVTTYSRLAEVIYERELEDGTRETLDSNNVSLNYGDNKIIIYAMSEDGNTSDEYVFDVHRVHDLTDITVPGDVTGPDMEDGSKNHISVQPGGTFNLLSEITYTPEDADYKDLIFTSNNTSLVTINSEGIITAADVLDKSTTIRIQSKTYPSIVKTINVTVEITLISSEVYTIEREKTGYDPYITFIELKTPIQTFFDNLDNDDRFLHIYDTSGTEVTDKTAFVGTGYKVTLESNGHTYDTLNIVVMGDINGDAYSNNQDLAFVKNHILKKSLLTGIQFLAADINHDDYVNNQDLSYFKNYILKKINSYLE